jgi:hypothetical protein
MRRGGVDINRAPKEALELVIAAERAGGGSSGVEGEGEEEMRVGPAWVCWAQAAGHEKGKPN